jgi:hypothetical protein
VHEPAVAITDFILAIECAVFAILIARKIPKSRYRMWLLVFFISIAAGALFGGLTHGFFSYDTPAARALWVATMVAIGVTAVTCWVLGAEILGRRCYPFRIAVGVSLFAYLGVSSYGWRSYRVVEAFYLPAALFLWLCAIEAVWRGRKNHIWTAIGIVLTFAAAGIQVARFALPLLDRNSLYHLLQAIALLLIYIGFARNAAAANAAAQNENVLSPA